MRRKVITLDPASFSDHCRRLQQLVQAAGFEPDAILSIRNGGEKVGMEMYPDVPHWATTLQRPSTRRKTKAVKRTIAMLPRVFNNWLRIIESFVLSISQRNARANADEVTLPQIAPAERILVVDDSCDSGQTLASVVAAVRAAYPNAEVRSAVITVTTTHPIITPDFTIYNDLTLCRFPWSMDA